MANKVKQGTTKETRWDLARHYYSSPADPRIDKDIAASERIAEKFKERFDGKRDWLKSPKALLEVLKADERISENDPARKAVRYLHHCQSLDSSDAKVTAKLTLVEERWTKILDLRRFFGLELGKLPKQLQEKFLANKELAPYRYYLQNIFAYGAHRLSADAERVMSLMEGPAHRAWTQATERELGTTSIDFDGEAMPLPKASNLVSRLPLAKRRALHEKVCAALKEIAPLAESEMNAIVSRKKAEDELRGYAKPQDEMIRHNEDDGATVAALVKAVTAAFPLAHRFYALKKRYMGLPELRYSDRATRDNSYSQPMPFAEATNAVRTALGSIHPRYAAILDAMLAGGQVDSHPRTGKRGGAFCSSDVGQPTVILLNHTDDADSTATYGHEMGHAIHSERSKSQRAIYEGYGLGVAETASTFFERATRDHIRSSAPEEARLAIVHNECQDTVQTVFRQIACFNLESALHTEIRSKGAISVADFLRLHNEHMASYCGPAMKIVEEDGYLFVAWPHLRYFFYVYTYAFGEIVSRALYERVMKDSSYVEQVDRFLSAGGSDSPANIFKAIGIDVSKPSFYREGLASIEKDIDEFERLLNQRDPKR